VSSRCRQTEGMLLLQQRLDVQLQGPFDGVLTGAKLALGEPNAARAMGRTGLTPRLHDRHIAAHQRKQPGPEHDAPTRLALAI
jgi:hypothetical protein